MIENEPKANADRDDEAFLSRFRAAWGRPEMTPTQTAGFSARLEARLATGQRPFRLVPALVGVGVVAALVTVVFVGRHQSPATDDGFLASLAEAEAMAQNVVVKADGTSQNVAYADAADGLWAILDDEAQDGVVGNLSNEYEALDAWVFPEKSTADESSKQK
jgi:hypothetical protein